MQRWKQKLDHRLVAAWGSKEPTYSCLFVFPVLLSLCPVPCPSQTISWQLKCLNTQLSPGFLSPSSCSRFLHSHLLGPVAALAASKAPWQASLPHTKGESGERRTRAGKEMGLIHTKCAFDRVDREIVFINFFPQVLIKIWVG